MTDPIFSILYVGDHSNLWLAESPVWVTMVFSLAAFVACKLFAERIRFHLVVVGSPSTTPCTIISFQSIQFSLWVTVNVPIEFCLCCLLGSEPRGVQSGSSCILTIHCCVYIYLALLCRDSKSLYRILFEWFIMYESGSVQSHRWLS